MPSPATATSVNAWLSDVTDATPRLELYWRREGIWKDWWLNLKQCCLGLIIDIVPNHYGQLAGKRPVATLEYGKESRYAR